MQHPQDRSSPPVSENLETVKSPRKWWVLVGIGLGSLMFSVDVSIVYVSLPTLVAEFHSNFTTIQWVTLSYLLVIAASIVSIGRLGDIFNKKWLYLTGLVVFTLGSLLCGLASTLGLLIGFRAFQGLGAVFMSALGAAIVTETFAVSGCGFALGTLGAISSLGVVLGPTIGGLLIPWGSWRSIFLVNVPIGIIAGLIGFYTISSAQTLPNKPQLTQPQLAPLQLAQPQFDFLGAIVLAIVLSGLTLGMTFGQAQGFNAPIPLALLTVTALGFVWFLKLEAQALEPMLDLSIFTNLAFSLSLFVGWTMYAVMAGTVFILPFFLEWVEHYSVQQVGLLQAVLPISVGLVEPISGRLSDRLGWRKVSLTGLMVMVFGCITLSTLGTQLTFMGYIFRVIPLGIGMGIFVSPNNTTIMNNVSQNRLGIASALLSLSRVLGHMVGVPLTGSLFLAFSVRNSQHLSSFELNSHNIAHIPMAQLVLAEHLLFRLAGCILVAGVMLLVYGAFQNQKAPQSA
jgi:EmrB/QacA subfamily drug resistance transporter